MRTLVSALDAMGPVLQLIAAIDPKHRAGYMSRPGSAVAYSRNEAAYDEQNAPAPLLTHQDVMDRFNVRSKHWSCMRH